MIETIERVEKKPGVYPNVPFAEYVRWSALNYSTLKHFMKSAKHGRYFELHDRDDDTASQRIGDAADAAIFTPDVFESVYVVRPAFNGRPRTNEYKDACRAWEDDNRDKVIVSQAEYDRAVRIRDAVRSNDLANQLLLWDGVKRRTQLSIVWRDRDTGLLCKSRIDTLAIVPDGPLKGACEVDLKSTLDPTPDGFPRQVAKFQYQLQAGMYIEGLEELAPQSRRALIVAVENDEPYDVVVHEFSAGAIESGRTRFRRLIRLYKQCLDSGRWPGSCEDVNLLILPKWAEETEAA